MTKTWQLQEAKNRFSELVNEALTAGPQRVTRRGEPVVVILSADEYQRIQKSQTPLSVFFRQSPLVGVELDLARDQSLPREVEV